MAEETQQQPTDTSECEPSACSSCESDCAERKAPAKLATHAESNVKHVIAVVSGKGGVGKTLVTSLIASALARTGHSVGVLDADITGPSIPKSFGVEEKLSATDTGLLPSISDNGIKLVSTNLVLPEDTTPVLWRGTIISGLVKQFFSEVIWGDLDYLILDMPPGTGDVPLTVFQSLPIDGIVIVTAPQDLVSMIVGKAINMARTMEVPVLGLVENMAYFKCPECGSQHEIYGSSALEELSRAYEIDLTAQLPIDTNLAQLTDAGRIQDAKFENLDKFIAGIIAKTEQ